MRKIFLAALLSAFAWGLPAAQAAPISLHVVDGDVRAVLASAARMGGMGLVLDDSVQGTITLQLDDVETEDVFRFIAAAKGLSLERTGDTFLLTTARAGADGLFRPYVFPVQYAELDTICAAVNLSLTKAGIMPPTTNITNAGSLSENKTGPTAMPPPSLSGGRVTVDRSTNSLVLFGTAAEADAARKLVSALDLPAKQVSLEARVVAIQKDAAKKLGVEWEWSRLPQYPDYTTTYESVRHTVQNADGSYTTTTEDVPKTTAERSWKDGESIPGIFRFGRGPDGHPFEMYYAATLNALVTDGKAKVLARPNITTLQGHEAVINIGGEVPVPTVATTNSTTTTSITYRQAGIILRYTPRVNADGRITAQVHTEVSSPLYVDELKAYRFQKRSADTTVRLKDGETMVIGGLIGSEESRSLSKVPFLGDLPILGAFFRNVRTSKTDSEIMIFLTAHVLED